MKNKETIWTSVQLRIGDITLCVDTTNELTQRLDVLKNSGYIEIDLGQIGEKAIFWDNLNFFMGLTYNKFKEECRDDLREYEARVSEDLKTKQTFKIIKRLMKKAYQLNLLTKEK